MIYCEVNKANKYFTYFKKRVEFSISKFSFVKISNLNKLLIIIKIIDSLIEIEFKRIDKGIFDNDYIFLSEVLLAVENLLLKIYSS